jgi:hypothetical protein
MRKRLWLIAAASLALGGCSKNAAFFDHSTSTTATTVVVTTTPTRPTLGPPLPTTAGATAKAGGSKIDAEQIIGRWRVTDSAYGAAFSAGDRLAFLQDGTFTINGGTLPGQWQITFGGILILDVRTIHSAYSVAFSGGEMDLNQPQGWMTLARTN